MKNDNITKWADDLRTTTERQTDGALAKKIDIGADAEVIGYCCIGFGCTFSAPDIRIEWPDDADDTDDALKGVFGGHRVDDLAPIEFMEWLGYDTHHWSMDQGAAFDIHPDWPTRLRVRSEYDKRDSMLGGDATADHLGKHLVSVSLAGLNDDGVTFAQIADIIHHFGLSDDPTGNDFTNDNH